MCPVAESPFLLAADASLYPPKDTLTLRHLLNSIQTCDFDRLKKDCLVFYLLLDYAGQEQAATFKDERALPARFARLTEGYWLLDGRRYEVRSGDVSLDLTLRPADACPISNTLDRTPSRACRSPRWRPTLCPRSSGRSRSTRAR